MTDYVAVAIEFANQAIKDKKGKSNGKKIRQAAKRFLDDLKRAKKSDCPFLFSEEEANRPCAFIELLPHVEGVWDPPTLKLHPAQCFFVVQLFGFRDKVTGARRFTSALYATARKSGKSTLAAGIMLYCMCFEDEPGAQLISAATTGDQAKKVWHPAKMMVSKCHDMQEEFGLQVWANSISRMETGASFKSISAKASTQDGLNPSHTAMDEIHAHKTADLLNVLTSAAGARRSPLWLYTTTEGYENPGPWSDIRSFCDTILKGGLGNEADHFLAVFFAVDDDDEEFDESCWVKANPLIDVNPNLLPAIRKEAVEAKQMPSKMAEFRIKRLNRRSSTADGWINLDLWRKCGEPVDLNFLKDYPCYGGLDLASNVDIAAFRLVWDVEGVLYTKGWRWVPADAVAYRTSRGTVPYASWTEKGYLKQTEGNTIDFRVIEEDILDLNEKFKIQQIAYDRWNATQIVNNLLDADIELLEFVQGPKSYHPAMKELERRYMSGKLAHGDDPVLNWCASNLIARQDMNENMAPDKKKSADKIDDMAALLMAVGVATNMEREEEPEYKMLFI